MRARLTAIAVTTVVVAAACRGKTKRADPPLADAVAFESTHLVFADAAPDAAPPPAPPRLAAYLRLLAADMYIKEIIETFPGAPKTAVFDSRRFWWRFPDLVELDTLAASLDEAARQSTSGAFDNADKAVGAYVTVATKVMPAVFDLAKYYKANKFVDDEFERGRREGPMVAAAGAALAAVRAELWNRVIVEWREDTGATADSPRAITGTAFETCLEVGAVMVTKGLGDAANAAVSGCRKAIGPVAALPDGVRNGFDEALRSTALELGNLAASGYTFYRAPQYIDALIEDYLALWPLLPQTPAERAHP